MKRISTQLRALLALAGVALVSTSASASNYAYICYSTFNPAVGTNGSYGYVWASTYSGAACTGNYLGTIRLCSKNATSTSCPSSASSQYSEAQILNLASAFRDAIENETQTYMYTTTCNGGAATCVGSVEFHTW